MPLENDPLACSTVASLHDAYERALIANDVATLQSFFWDSPDTVRFGVSEQSFGAEAITHYRRNAQPPASGRKMIRRSVVSFGPDHVSVMCEIMAVASFGPCLVRQSQVWVRFPDAGWRIVSAHVSRPCDTGRPWAEYAGQAARAIDLPLSAAELPAVALQLERAAGIAAPLLAHPVPDSVERAAIFTA
jgi:hypothetical protein